MELKTPKKPLSRATFAEGCENDPKRCPKTQKCAFWRSKPVFAAKIAFWRENEKMSGKMRKGWKWASKHVKKHCLQKGLRDGRKMNASGAKKYPILKNSALLRPKRVLGAFCSSGRKKSSKSILDYFWLPKRTQNLMFSTVLRTWRKRWSFAKKLLFEEGKSIKRLFLARHKNMKSCQKLKTWFSHTFARSAKPLIIVRFWAPFFDQNRKNPFFNFW